MHHHTRRALALLGALALCATVHAQDLEAGGCGATQFRWMGDPATAISDIDHLRQTHVKEIDQAYRCTPVTADCREDGTNPMTQEAFQFNQAEQLVRMVGAPMQFGRSNSTTVYVYNGTGRYSVAEATDGDAPVPNPAYTVSTNGPVNIFTYQPNDKGLVRAEFRMGYMIDEVLQVGHTTERIDCVFQKTGQDGTSTMITQDVTDGDDHSKQYVQEVRTFDPKGLMMTRFETNQFGWKEISKPSDMSPTSIAYRYTKFDAKGNWTERRECTDDSLAGKQRHWCTTQTRILTYW
jgi:hypothetical protein